MAKSDDGKDPGSITRHHVSEASPTFQTLEGAFGTCDGACHREADNLCEAKDR